MAIGTNAFPSNKYMNGLRVCWINNIDKKENPEPHQGLLMNTHDKPTVMYAFSLNVKYLNKILSPTMIDIIINSKVNEPWRISNWFNSSILITESLLKW
jgi:hypothetical protein